MAPIPHIPNIDTPPVVARPLPPPDDPPAATPFAAGAATRPDPDPIAALNAAGSPQIGPPALDHTAAATTDLPHPDAPPDAAGPGYASEWELFCDYTTATDQPALPTTVPALTGFLAALPARPATVARRIRAIAAAHRRAGHLLTRPEDGPAAPRTHPAPAPRRGNPGLMIAACPTRGWPAGLTGRRDALLIVLTESLEYTHRAARRLRPANITVPTTGPPDQAVPRLAGRAAPSSDDPRTCPACAVTRWLDILGVADGLGRGSARTALAAADAPTPASPHQHTPSEPARRCGWGR